MKYEFHLSRNAFKTDPTKRNKREESGKKMRDVAMGEEDRWRMMSRDEGGEGWR